MATARVSRTDLAELFHKGALRKRQESNRFAIMSVQFPNKGKLYSALADYTAVDARYYDMASWYYSGEMSSLEDGSEDDLLMLVAVSELSPKLYAMYLREIDPESREAEKMTHKLLMQLKTSIRQELSNNL